MTPVHGVKFIGTREQVARRLEETNDKNRLLRSRSYAHLTVLEGT